MTVGSFADAARAKRAAARAERLQTETPVDTARGADPVSGAKASFWPRKHHLDGAASDAAEGFAAGLSASALRAAFAPCDADADGFLRVEELGDALGPRGRDDRTRQVQRRPPLVVHHRQALAQLPDAPLVPPNHLRQRPVLAVDARQPTTALNKGHAFWKQRPD